MTDAESSRDHQPAMPEGSVGEFLSYILPGCMADDAPCPGWPPDAFALCAALVDRTGVYVRLVELDAEDRPNVLETLAEDHKDGWPGRAKEIGCSWRAAIQGREQVVDGDVELPAEIRSWWDVVKQARAMSIEKLIRKPPDPSDPENPHAVACALLGIACAADEAAAGVGIRKLNDEDPFLDIALFQLTVQRTLGIGVSQLKVRVLPKQHTPQRGITVRSISHNLALCEANDVENQWLPPVYTSHHDAPDADPRLGRMTLCNLLLLPWPNRVDARHFENSSHEVRGDASAPFGFFDYDRRKPDETDLERSKRLQALEESMRAALLAGKEIGDIDAVVFPELSLLPDELMVVRRVAREHNCLVAGGVAAGPPDIDVPINMAFVDATGLRPPSARGPLEEANPDTEYRQRKHHRWCIDRNQAVQYGLGGRIPANRNSWEASDVGRRELFFLTLDSWLTMCVLLCEDLARPDPVTQALRAVGPTLVITLLMDGPQLKQRWSARYASVLAEDPGCSVLTLTSLGMADRTRCEFPESDATRLVALWRDVRQGERELTLPEGRDAGVLCLAKRTDQEWTADGRGDGRRAHVPEFAGWHPLAVEPTWPVSN